LVCSEFIKEFLISLLLLSLTFLIPINLCYNMGSCIELLLIYVIFGCVSYFIKYFIKKIAKRNNKLSNE
jgi:hypothetical protein